MTAYWILTAFGVFFGGVVGWLIASNRKFDVRAVVYSSLAVLVPTLGYHYLAVILHRRSVADSITVLGVHFGLSFLVALCGFAIVAGAVALYRVAQQQPTRR